MARHPRPVALPGAPHRADPQGHRPRAQGPRASLGAPGPRAGAGGGGPDAQQRRLGVAARARQGSAHHDVSRSLRAFPRRGEGRAGRARRRRYRCRAERGRRHQSRDASTARRLGSARRGKSVAEGPHQPGLSLDQHHRREGLGADDQRRPGPAVGRAGSGERQLQVGRTEPALAGRDAPGVPAGGAARAHRHDRIVRKLAAWPAGQHRRAGRLRRRPHRDQGRRRRQGHQPADQQRGSRPRGVRPLCVPAAAERWALFGEREGLDPAQQPQGRGAVAQGGRLRAERRCTVQGRSQRHANDYGQCRRQQDRCVRLACATGSALDCPRARAASRAAVDGFCGELARPFDDFGDGADRRAFGPFDQGRERLARPQLRREALHVSRRRLGRQRLGRLRSRLRSVGPHRLDDPDRYREPGADGRSRRPAGLRSRSQGGGRRCRAQAAGRRSHCRRGAEQRERRRRVRRRQGCVAGGWAGGMAGRVAAPARRQ